MTKDPVCGKQVDPNKAAATSNYQGRHYAFCGQECKDKFDKNPQEYVGSAQREPQEQPAHR